MNKKSIRSFYKVFICIGLIILILVTFWHTTYGEKKQNPSHSISVILYAAGSDGWESLQEGLKRAEEDFSVHLNYITLRENAGAKEQIEIIEREIINGAEGIIVAVNDYETLYKFWQEKAFSVPIVAVESGFGENKIPFISADNYEMGKVLGEEILKDFAGKDKIVVAIESCNEKKDSVQKREQGVYDALEGKAQVIKLDGPVIAGVVDAVVALDKESLQKLANNMDAGMSSVKKYGIGNTASIVASLDQGKIEKIVFQNEFNMGYLAVETVLGELGSIEREKRENIDFYSVKGEDIYNPPYEQLLFPIVE